MLRRETPAFVRPIVVAGFLSALALTAVVDRLHPALRPRPILDRADREAEARARNRLVDGTAAATYAADLAAVSRVGHDLRPIYGALMYAALRALPSGVATDADGRFYVRERSSRPADGDETADQAAAIVRAVARRMAARGSRLVFCAVPEKDLVHADAAPPGVAGDRAAFGRLVRRLTDAGLPAPDLLAALDRVRVAGEEPFFLGDTHWTFAGAMAAAEAAAESAGLRIAPASRTSRIETWFEVEAPTDTLQYAGFGSEDPDVRRRVLAVLAGVVRPPKFAFRRTVDANGAAFDYDPLAKDRTATVIGTSYSDFLVAPWFPAFVAHAIDRPVRSHAIGAAGAGLPLSKSHELALGAGYSPITFWEVPSSLIFATPTPLERAGDYLAIAVPKVATQLLDAAEPGATSAAGAGDGVAPKAGERVVLSGDGSARRFVFRGGRVAADGGGAVGVRVSGDVLRGTATVRVTSGGRSILARWQAPMAELTLPVLAAGAGDIVVEVSGDDAEVLWRKATLSLDVTRAGARSAVESDGKYVFQDRSAVEAMSVLEIVLPGAERLSGGGRRAFGSDGPSGAESATGRAGWNEGAGSYVVRRNGRAGGGAQSSDAPVGVCLAGAVLYVDAFVAGGVLDEVVVLRDGAPVSGAVVAILPPPRP